MASSDVARVELVSASGEVPMAPIILVGVMTVVRTDDRPGVVMSESVSVDEVSVILISVDVVGAC